jgi:hypothetical protein
LPWLRVSLPLPVARRGSVLLHRGGRRGPRPRLPISVVRLHSPGRQWPRQILRLPPRPLVLRPRAGRQAFDPRVHELLRRLRARIPKLQQTIPGVPNPIVRRPGRTLRRPHHKLVGGHIRVGSRTVVLERSLGSILVGHAARAERERSATTSGTQRHRRRLVQDALHRAVLLLLLRLFQ